MLASKGFPFMVAAGSQELQSHILRGPGPAAATQIHGPQWPRGWNKLIGQPGSCFTWLPCCTSGSRVGPLRDPRAQSAGESDLPGPPSLSPLGHLTPASLFLASKALVPVFSGASPLQRAEAFPRVRASAFSSANPLPSPGKEKLNPAVCVCVCVCHTAQHANALPCQLDT